MNTPGNDNRQLALNIMHWLSGLLPANDAALRIDVQTAVRNSNISPAVTTINAKTNETIEAAKGSACIIAAGAKENGSACVQRDIFGRQAI
jgi:hypothetical protein